MTRKRQNPLVEELRSELHRAYQKFGMKVAKWAMEDPKGRPEDLEEIGRRYAVGRAAMEFVLQDAMQVVQQIEQPDVN